MINKKTTIFAALLLIFLTLSAIQAQNSIQNKYRLANSFERAGDIEKAKEIYEELTGIKPENETFVRALNNIYLQFKEYPESIALLERAAAASPKNIDFYGMLGATYYIKGEDGKAFEIWDEAVKNFPDQNFRYRTIANYAIENRAFDKAIEILKDGKENAAEPEQYAYDLANLYSGTMKFEQAAEEYAFALERQPKQLMMIRARIQNYIFSVGAFEPTAQVLEERYKESDLAVFLELLSYFYRQRGDFDRAFELAKELDKKSENNGSKIFSFAQDAYREGNYEAAAKAYNEIIKSYGSSALITSSKLGYARSEEARLNREAKAGLPDWKINLKSSDGNRASYKNILTIYEELSDVNSEPRLVNEAIFRQGKILKTNLDDLEAAKSKFTFLINNAPVSELAQNSLLEMGKIYIKEGNLDAANESLQKILKLDRNPVQLKNEANFLLGKINFWQSHFDEAKNYLNEAAQNLEDDFSNNAIELSMIINTFRNDSLNLSKFAYADFLSAQEKFGKAKEEFRLIASDNSLFLLNDLAKFRFAETAVAENDLPTASEILKEILLSEKENFYSDKSLYLLAEIYFFGFGDEDSALSYYEKLLERFPNSLYFEKSREKINKIVTKRRNSI